MLVPKRSLYIKITLSQSPMPGCLNNFTDGYHGLSLLRTLRGCFANPATPVAGRGVYQNPVRSPAGNSHIAWWAPPGHPTKIANAVAQANQSYLRSNVDMQINVVHTQEINYVETGDMTTSLSALTDPNDGKMDKVHALRNQYAADQVVLTHL